MTSQNGLATADFDHAQNNPIDAPQNAEQDNKLNDFVSYYDSLMANGYLSWDQCEIIRDEQQNTQQTLRTTLLKSGFMSDEQYLEWACKVSGIDMIPEELSIRSLKNIGKELCKIYEKYSTAYKRNIEDFECILVDYSDSKATLATKDPLDKTLNQPYIRLFSAHDVNLVACPERELSNLRNLLSIENQNKKDPQKEMSDNEKATYAIEPLQSSSATNQNEHLDQNLFTLSPGDPENPNQLVAEIIYRAIQLNASDIHFSPKDLSLCIRYRHGGELHLGRYYKIKFWPQILSCLKIMAKMRPEEKCLPQSGRFSQFIHGRKVDFRASSHPTTEGENFVLRVLDQLHSVQPLDELGFDPEDIDLIKTQVLAPYGMIIVTGPTGSGKTTTLYSILSYLKEKNYNIMTLEDPVEYKIPEIRQTQVNEDIGLTFASGIRSILRQDPDIILVGEIRDEETAQMALRASMTGHLVLTTLHTNSCLSAPRRLLDLGVNPDLLTGNINCIISQRLIKRPLSKSRGGVCDRLPIAEILPVTPELDRLFMNNATYYELLDCARKEGFASMSDKAKEKIANKQLSKEDVQRVLNIDLAKE